MVSLKNFKMDNVIILLLIMIGLAIGVFTFFLSPKIFIILLIGLVSAILLFFNPKITLFLFIASLPFVHILMKGPFVSVSKLLGIILLVGFIFYSLRTKKLVSFQFTKLNIALLLFVPLIFVSNLVSGDIINSLFSSMTFLLILIFYIIFLNYADSFKFIKYVFVTIVASNVIVCIFSLLQFFGSHLFLTKQDYVGDFIRVTGTAGDPNYLALYLVTSLPLCLVLINSATSKLYKYLFYASALLIFTTLLLTFSRSGLLALIIISFLYFIKLVKTNKRFLKYFLIIGVIALIFSVTIIGERVSSINSLMGVRSLEDVEEIDDISLRQRFNIQIAGIKMWMQSPVFGIGINNFRDNSVEYMPDYDKTKHVAHNTYLEILAGAGLISFVVFMYIIITTYLNIKNIQRSIKDKLGLQIIEGIELSFVACIIMFIFITSYNFMYFWLMVAVVSTISSWRGYKCK